VFEGLKDFNSLDRCITRGMPATMLPFPYNNGVRVFQSPGLVVINHEMIHEQRFIPLDGRRSRPRLHDLARQLARALRGRHAGGRDDQLQRPLADGHRRPEQRHRGHPDQPSMKIVEHFTPRPTGSITRRGSRTR
jgi:hypothetical protein